MPTKTVPYVKGRVLELSAGVGVKEDVFAPTFDTELLSVAMGANRYFPMDYWELRIAENLVFETIYTKDLPEGCYLMAVMPVAAGTQLKFTFHNVEMAAKYVWFNYQFLK